MEHKLKKMHDRHQNRERYFNEQVFTTTNFVIPYLEEVMKISPEITVADNKKPFLASAVASVPGNCQRLSFSTHVCAWVYSKRNTVSNTANIVILFFITIEF